MPSPQCMYSALLDSETFQATWTVSGSLGKTKVCYGGKRVLCSLPAIFFICKTNCQLATRLAGIWKCFTSTQRKERDWIPTGWRYSDVIDKMVCLDNCSIAFYQLMLKPYTVAIIDKCYQFLGNVTFSMHCTIWKSETRLELSIPHKIQCLNLQYIHTYVCTCMQW